MKPAPHVPRRPTVAFRFRAEIQQAASQGVSLDQMALHLTLGDAELLKRDRAVPVADISFADGVMTYLGVKILKGDVSVLNLQATA